MLPPRRPNPHLGSRAVNRLTTVSLSLSFSFSFFSSLTLFITGPLQAFDEKSLVGIDSIASKAISAKEIPGAVVAVIHDQRTVYEKAHGRRSILPEPTAMTVDTHFDMASITKPVATGTSIHILIEQGKLALNDPVSKHWPEFAVNGKSAVTIEQCLLHTTGLTADNSIKDYANGRAAAMTAIANLKLEAEPGTRFRYSDVGFIVLGEIVERVSGQPLDRFTAKHVFEPLKMTETGFNPNIHDKTAPTGRRDGKIIIGRVHDPRADAMGGVAGHAGLFSTAADMGRYCRMILNNGELDGVRLLSAESVRRFTAPHPVPGGGQRSLGWDVATSFTSQRGALFPAGEGFGHTGFTGTSVWIDPTSRTAIIVLTNRVHPDDKGNASPIRRAIGTLVASATDGIAARRAPVKTGLDVLIAEKFQSLQGKRIGLVTNHTGRSADGTHIIDCLAAEKGITLVALFSPEHGLRGEKDENVGDSQDERTGLPIYSLYGERRKPTAETLKGIDTLVYDIQDIGCRFYTYASTLGLVLEAAKEHGITVIVLDRPNPLGGMIIEGPVRDPGPSSFVGFHTVPVRHGLTVGELAKMFNSEKGINAKLTVVPCQNWSRGDTWDRTGLPWRNPSPNMRHLTAAMLYPGIGLMEFTNVSVGRGTERPFEWIGAPFIDGRVLAKELNALALPGVRFVPVTRSPMSSTHAGKECGGVDIIVDDCAVVKPVSVGIGIMTTLTKQYPKDWATTKLNTLILHAATSDAIKAGKSLAEIQVLWTAGLDEYRTRRSKSLIYPES
jgi:uncharacterized protein YbbC (DUF1343 family)/CubicO group peptidase (beta-lactamase class C family)